MKHARPRTGPSPALRAGLAAACVAIVLVPVALVAHATTGHDGEDAIAPTLQSFPVLTPLPTLTAPAAAEPVTRVTRPRAKAKVAKEPVAIPASFGFVGSGWGHGVGMSQVGAFGMASQGATAAVILKHYYTGTRVQKRDDDAALAVNVAHAVRTVRFGTEALVARGGALRVVTDGARVDGEQRELRTNSGPADAWTATIGEHGITLRRDGEIVATRAGTVTLTWAGTRYASRHHAKNLRRHAPTVLTLGSGSSSHQYRYGRVVLHAHTGGAGRIEAVNEVRLHGEYLRGLGEVPSNWPAAALQAQVVAARSYALVKQSRGIKAVCDCNLDSGPGRGPFQDQNYVGWSKESAADGARWVAAVRATSSGRHRGKVVTYGGEVAQTFYFASSGGRTESSRDVWGSARPYLRSVDDRWSLDPRYNPLDAHWGPVVRSQSAVAAAFGLTDVVAVRSTRSSTGVCTGEARSSKGRTARRSGLQLAHALHLRSVWLETASPPGA